jgi:ferredoxin
MSYRIRIRTTGEEFLCPPDTSLLAGMERLGRHGIPVGCRGGGCGVCRIAVEAGRVCTGRMSRRHVSEADQAAGIVLACRAYPDSDVTLQPLDRLADRLARGHDGLAGVPRATPPTLPNTIELQR